MTLCRLTATLLLLLANPAAAQSADAILGTWLTTDEDGYRDSVVEIVRQGTSYTGLVRWVALQTYPAGDHMAGQPLVDRENPDPALRERPVLGLPVLQGLQFSGDSWQGGTIYSVRSGKTYRVRLKLPRPGTLEVRGYLATPLFGESVYWSRSAIPPEPDALSTPAYRP